VKRTPAHDVSTHDRWIVHPEGRLFARTWSPAGAAPQLHAGSPIVLFHDSLGCVALWRDFPARLAHATGQHVVAYDRLGFGKSDPRAELPPVDFVGDEATHYFPSVREQLGLRRFIPFGHSVGGGMAIHCAALYAADCRALITEAAQVFPEDRTLDGIRAAKEQFKDPAQVERLARYHGAKARWVLDAWIENWLSEPFASWTMVGVLPQVHCPVLAIHGVDDEYGSTIHPDLIGEHAGGEAYVHVLPDTSHVPHRERPDLVLQIVADFLGGLAPI